MAEPSIPNNISRIIERPGRLWCEATPVVLRWLGEDCQTAYMTNVARRIVAGAGGSKEDAEDAVSRFFVPREQQFRRTDIVAPRRLAERWYQQADAGSVMLWNALSSKLRGQIEQCMGEMGTDIHDSSTTLDSLIVRSLNAVCKSTFPTGADAALSGRKMIENLFPEEIIPRAECSAFDDFRLSYDPSAVPGVRGVDERFWWYLRLCLGRHCIREAMAVSQHNRRCYTAAVEQAILEETGGRKSHNIGPDTVACTPEHVLFETEGEKERTLLATRIREGIQRLRPNYRVVLERRFLSGYPRYREADITDPDVLILCLCDSRRSPHREHLWKNLSSQTHRQLLLVVLSSVARSKSHPFISLREDMFLNNPVLTSLVTNIDSERDLPTSSTTAIKDALNELVSKDDLCDLSLLHFQSTGIDTIDLNSQLASTNNVRMRNRVLIDVVLSGCGLRLNREAAASILPDVWMPYDEISRELGISVGNVKARLSRGLAELRNGLVVGDNQYDFASYKYEGQTEEKR